MRTQPSRSKAVGSIAIVPVSELRPNSYNPQQMTAEMYRKELASIRKFGFVDPITARLIDGALEIIDGEHRWKAARELGIAEVPVWVIEGLTDEEAKQLTIVLNETRGSPDQGKLGILLRDLLENVPKADLLDVLPIDPVKFDQLAGLDGFDWGALGKAGSEEPNRWVERTYRLPADAALVIDEAIEKAKDGEELHDWQGLELVAAEYLATGAMPSPQPMVRASTAALR